MDKDGSGILDINDIKQNYNAKMHPDVKKGKGAYAIICAFRHSRKKIIFCYLLI